MFKSFRRQTRRANADTQLAIKLFFILGLTWIFDITAFAIEKYQMTKTDISESSNLVIESVLVIFLVINASHGIIFFFIIYCTSANINKIKIWCGIAKAQRAFSNYYSSLRKTSSSNRTRNTSIRMSTFRRHSDNTQSSFIRSSRMRSKRATNDELNDD